MTINIPDNIDNITFNGNDLDELKVNGTTIWSSGIHPKPMYIESKQNGSTVYLSKTGSPSETYYTSPDNRTAYQAYTYGTSITLNAGDRLYWYSPTTQSGHSVWDYVKFVMSGNFKVGGNIQSLNNYSTSVGEAGYCRLFQNCTAITDISELKLPATTLANYSYFSMFNGCTSITTAPVLTATTVGKYCYQSMFNGCTSLTTAPVLTATTLANGCYQNMFQNCTSLTTVPSNMLPATTLTYMCYYQMFDGCSSLTVAPELPATTLVSKCYQEMFYGCSSLSSVTALFTDAPNIYYSTSDWLYNVSSTGTFTMSADAQWNPENYRNASGVPVGWTVRTKTIYDNPMYIESKQDGSTFYLSKTGSPSETYYISTDNASDAYQPYTYGTQITLDEGERLYFYSQNQSVHSGSNYVRFYMTGDFKVGGNIQSLNNYSTSVGDYGYYQLFYGCSAITDVSDLLLTATTVGDYGYSYMFYNCSGITTPPTISATTFTGSNNCDTMFAYCTSLTTAPVLPATTVTSYCYYCMFQGCSSITTVPSNMLPATTLSNNSYHDMFKGCSSLTASPEIPATTVSYWSCCGMFYGCTSMTTAASILPATTLAGGCYRGMYRNTGITASPILPAASVNETEGSSYMQMFDGSSSLASITCYLENMPSNGLNYWVDGVSSTGTFTMSANANWNPENYRGVSGVPNDWTVTTVTPQ